MYKRIEVLGEEVLGETTEGAKLEGAEVLWKGVEVDGIKVGDCEGMDELKAIGEGFDVEGGEGSSEEGIGVDGS